MEWYEALAILSAGVAAGTINAVVGSGTLITFPTLLALGYPPVMANMSNNVGLVAGNVTATWGYRRELLGQGSRLRLLGPMSLLGAATGAVLLLVLPASAFARIVPVLLAISVVMVLLQPRLQSRLVARRARQGLPDDHPGHTRLAAVGTYLAGIYGGYFGAAQGVLLVGILGSLLPETLQRVNAVKNALALVVNGVAAAVFCLVAFHRIDWAVVALIAVGSLAGGALGASVGRRLPPVVLRGTIAVIGSLAIWRVLAF